jgi:hypothetical protein
VVILALMMDVAALLIVAIAEVMEHVRQIIPVTAMIITEYWQAGTSANMPVTVICHPKAVAMVSGLYIVQVQN